MVDPALDKRFDCLSVDEEGNLVGIPVMSMEVTGYTLARSFVLKDYPLRMETSIWGTSRESSLVGVTDRTWAFAMEMDIMGTGITQAEQSNWVAWSQIGAADFELNRLGDAGYRPKSWSGCVYQILPLDKSAIVYGSNGITLMYPVTEPMATFGFKDLLSQGIRCRTAVTGSEHIHYFISSYGDLWRMDQEGPAKLGYRKFLDPLRNPVLLWNDEKQRLFITDKNTGYVYGQENLGGWLPGVTGILWVDEALAVVSPRMVVPPSMEIATSVMDLTTRGRKSLEGIELGMESTVPIWVAVDYRYDKSQKFRTSPWVRMSPSGYARLRVSAVDFRIRLTNDMYAPFKISYMNLMVKFPDKRFARSARVSTGASD